MGLFKRRKKIAPVPSPAVSPIAEKERFYCASFEDLSPGYEEVYEPFFAAYRNNSSTEELVLARFLNREEHAQTLDEACADVLIFFQKMKEQGITADYKRISGAALSPEEKDAVDKLERNVQELI